MTARTEEEMKQVWCAEARVVDLNGHAAGNSGYAFTDSMCMGSKCAAWRWFEYPNRRISDEPVDGWEHMPPERSARGIDFWLEPVESAQKRRRGYCGKAGDVQFP